MNLQAIRKLVEESKQPKRSSKDVEEYGEPNVLPLPSKNFPVEALSCSVQGSDVSGSLGETGKTLPVGPRASESTVYPLPVDPESLDPQNRVQVDPEPLSSSEQQVLGIASPFDFLSLFDERVNTGDVVLYPWQMEILDSFVQKKYTKYDPYEGAKVCCNGSGKDKYIIAPFAVWFLCCKKMARCIITTASGNQLATQTEPYIKQLCAKVNEFLGHEFITIKQRHFTCKKTGSEICLFATDEGTKAEGYHPWEDWSEMALIINEAKGVAPEIFEALERCTGYNYNLMVSSPGSPSGNFYNYFISGIPNCHKVTAYDCQHIPITSIEKTATLYGRDSALFRSKILAEFTNIEGQTVISDDDFEAMMNNKLFEFKNNGDTFAGLDLAHGGDEIVLSVFRDNHQVSLETFLCADGTVAADILVKLFEKHSLKGYNVNADDGGLGSIIIDILHRKGYYVNRVLNQSMALDTSAFQNRGAELYFNFNRLIKEKVIRLLKDPKQKQQLVSRKYKQSSALGKICLQSKKEAKAEGQHSPDRADATVLAFAGKSIFDYIQPNKSTASKRTTASNIIDKYSKDKGLKEGSVNRIMEATGTDPYAECERQMVKRESGRVFGCISRIFNN